MSTKTIKLNKGELIAVKGTNYNVVSSTNIRVKKSKEDVQEAEPVGGHQTDNVLPMGDHTTVPFIERKKVLSIIEKEIERLQQKENKTLFDIGENELLFELGEDEATPHASISEHISIVAEITNLQELLKEIKEL